MTEAFPYGYEADDDKERSLGKNRQEDKRAVRPPLIEHSKGDSPLKRHEVLLRPIGEAADSKDKSVLPGPDTPMVEGGAPHAQDVHNRGTLGRELEPQTPRVSDDSTLQSERSGHQGTSELVAMSPEELGDLAAADVQAHLQAQEIAPREIENSDEDNDEDEDKLSKEPAAKQIPAVELASSPETEQAAPESFDSMMAQEASAELTDSTSGAILTNEAAPDLQPVPGVAVEMPSAENDAPHVTRETEVHDFQDFVQQHPELGDLVAPLSTETLAAEDNPSDDEIFRDIVRNETGEDPLRATLYDVEPGEPPVYAGNGAGMGPPSLPTAEGGAWEGDNGANPNRARLPSGAVVDSITWAGIAGLGVRERFHRMEDRLAQVGMFGGALLLAAGLIGEHLRGNKTRRMVKEQGKAHAEALSTANEALQREQLARQKTSRRLEDLSAAQTASNEQLEHVSQSSLPKAEAGFGSGLLSAAAAAELAVKTGQTVETRQSQAEANRELVHQFKDSRELGRALKRNPELRDSLTAGDGSEVAGASASEQQRAHELRELVGSSTYADIIRRERNYEHLHGRSNDDAGQQGNQSQSSGAADIYGTSSPPTPQLAVGVAGQLTDQLPPEKAERPANKSSLTKPIAAATVLCIVGIIIIIMISR